MLIYGTVSKITISPKHAEQFKIIAARIYSTETEIEIPLLEETVVRLGFLMELKLSINMILINHWCSRYTVAYSIMKKPEKFRCLHQ